ncbi:MAG TPA: membrane protein insertase YidC [Candidatus Nitrosopolaris sp.]|nr:membrane protein insertase YidC [Candidatus Nitrosopolaris sp.]
MLTTIIVQPIFNLLVLVYALIPGHNFGLAIIIFTIIIRLLMWPLVKKQLHHAKAMRELAPELKKIKAAAKGDRQKESTMTMELYKEREINPFASLGIILIQLPIIIGLYSSVRRIVNTPHEIISFSYPALHHLSWLKQLSANIHRFDDSLFGLVNLGRKALDSHGFYWPALAIVALSAVAQYYQAKQLMPKSKDSRGLRQILSEAGKGKTADQAEVNAAVMRNTQFLIPGVVFLFGMSFPAALPLYWLTSSGAAYLQQARILRADASEADASVKVTYSKLDEKQPKDDDKKAKISAKKRAARKNRRRR